MRSREGGGPQSGAGWLRAATFAANLHAALTELQGAMSKINPCVGIAIRQVLFILTALVGMFSTEGEVHVIFKEDGCICRSGACGVIGGFCQR
jgi:hypothetical protein